MTMASGTFFVLFFFSLWIVQVFQAGFKLQGKFNGLPPKSNIPVSLFCQDSGNTSAAIV
jgi:hypothetical protein